MEAGYSGTPLSKKLGIKPGSKLRTEKAPEAYPVWLEPLPEAVVFDAQDAEADMIHLFETDRVALTERLKTLRHTIRLDAFIWVSWPKKTSKVATDITEDVIRDVALPLGLVDIKVCAVSDIWSGLKLVIRKELR
jgi:hypothetical protein